MSGKGKSARLLTDEKEQSSELMATGEIVSRLHLLVDGCVRRFTEREVNSLTKEVEKDVLFSLSQVLREIQSWMKENVGDSAAATSSMEAGEQAVDHEEAEATLYAPGSKEYLCLERLVADLVSFSFLIPRVLVPKKLRSASSFNVDINLNMLHKQVEMVSLLRMKSVHVQHLAGNILVEVSQSLVESGSRWDVFIRLLCDSMHLAVIYIVPILDVSFAIGELELHLNGFDLLKCKLENANWCTGSGIFRVLRNILKRLSHQENEELLAVYLRSVSSTLANVDWRRLSTICSHQHGSIECNSQSHNGTIRSVANSEEETVFLGNFVQFLCSMVQQVRLVEDYGDIGPTDLMHKIIVDLVPDLLNWCQPKLESRSGTCMSRYLMHKLLVLMIRLTYQSDIKCTILLSWLQFLQRHFQGFLQHTISRCKPIRDNCLEGSPFFLSFCDAEVDVTHSNHLQRLSVFLFLKCSFTLLYSRKHTDKHCKFGCRKIGLVEMFKWIEQQIPGDPFSNHGTYTKKSIDFSLSFVRLYMHDDGLLFKVLLQLLYVPLNGEKLSNEEGHSLKDEEQTVLFRLSTLFNPVILFCIFLSELHYDHQVLLDYLISKDIGASCAEYLLRCLRAVCDSWTLFVEFQLEGNLDESSSKRRKILRETSEIERNCEVHPQAFEDAKDCLLALQNSIVKLHQKKLFPYNPEALLRRLSRFQELCLSHE